MTAEDYALQKQREARSGYDFTTNDIEEAFDAGMQEMMQRFKEYAVDADFEEKDDETIVFYTKNLTDDDMEARGICLFNYLNVKIVLIQTV